MTHLMRNEFLQKFLPSGNFRKMTAVVLEVYSSCKFARVYCMIEHYKGACYMKYSEILNYLSSLKKFGMKPGLERMRKLMSYCGNPQRECKFFHVAGTNGKGSVSMYIYNILLASGIKAGLFISPYVLDFRERIQIGGEMISTELMERAFGEVKGGIDALAESGDAPTEFEVTTAMAFVAYKISGCEAVVLETGLGGRLDSTNIIEVPLCSVITSISYDHTAVLGDTIEQIAAEKCGIIKRGCPVAASPQEYDGALTIIEKACRDKGSVLRLASADKAEIKGQGIQGTDITYCGMNIHIPLLGAHQVANAVTAVEAVRVQKEISLSDGQIIAGIAQTRFPARFEVISEIPPIILDGAHNPSAFGALAASAAALLPGGFDMVIGMTAEKDYRESVKIIAPMCGRIIVTAPAYSRTPALPPEELAKECRSYCSDVAVAESHEELREIIEKMPLRPLLACGSLYLASEIRPMLIDIAKRRQNNL